MDLMGLFLTGSSYWPASFCYSLISSSLARRSSVIVWACFSLRLLGRKSFTLLRKLTIFSDAAYSPMFVTNAVGIFLQIRHAHDLHKPTKRESELNWPKRLICYWWRNDLL